MTIDDGLDDPGAYKPTTKDLDRIEQAMHDWRREHPLDDREIADVLESLDFQNWLHGIEDEPIATPETDDFGDGIMEDE